MCYLLLVTAPVVHVSASHVTVYHNPIRVDRPKMSIINHPGVAKPAINNRVEITVSTSTGQTNMLLLIGGAS